MRTFNSSAIRSSVAAVFAVTVISLTAWSLESYLGFLQRNSHGATSAQYIASTDRDQRNG